MRKKNAWYSVEPRGFRWTYTMSQNGIVIRGGGCTWWRIVCIYRQVSGEHTQGCICVLCTYLFLSIRHICSISKHALAIFHCTWRLCCCRYKNPRYAFDDRLYLCWTDGSIVVCCDHTPASAHLLFRSIYCSGASQEIETHRVHSRDLPSDLADPQSKYIPLPKRILRVHSTKYYPGATLPHYFKNMIKIFLLHHWE